MLLSENDLLWSALVLKTTLHEQYPKEPQRSGLQPPAWHAANKLFTGLRTSENLSPSAKHRKLDIEQRVVKNGNSLRRLAALAGDDVDRGLRSYLLKHQRVAGVVDTTPR